MDFSFLFINLFYISSRDSSNNCVFFHILNYNGIGSYDTIVPNFNCAQHFCTGIDFNIITNDRCISDISITQSYTLINPTIRADFFCTDNCTIAMLNKDPPSDFP